MKAKIYSKKTGRILDVTSTAEHPDSSYGQPVWINKNGQAICVVGFEQPLYELVSMQIEDLQTLGMMLKHLRIKNCKSIRDFAKECGISKSTIVNVEKGAFNPRWDVIQKITQTLGAKITIE